MTNIEIVETLRDKINGPLVEAVKAAEQAQINLAGELIDIPQQAKTRLKQKVNSIVVDCRSLLNQIQV